MSDKKQQNLTPAEQQKQDEGRVQAQLTVTDMSETAGRIMESFGFGNPRSGGRTSFEGHELNAMIDLVENSNPEHLESAGEALWKARDAIRGAAKELGDHIDAVDWQGESGDAFRKWGKGLVAHATRLSDFAEAAGTQITVAGTGLASVRSAMPPRDGRLVRKRPDDIEFPARIEGNPEYEAALKVEKNRQEAINQVNRLASYYSVSEEVLAGQEPPRFEETLKVAMPRPDAGRGPSPSPEPSPQRTEISGSSTAPTASGRAVPGEAEAVAAGDRRTPVGAVGSASVPEKSISTEINSVVTPPAPTTITSVAPTPMPTSTAGPVGGPTPPPMTAFASPVQASSPRPTGPPGIPRSASQPGPGKAQAIGGVPTANGPAGSAVGRPGPMGGAAGHPGVAGGRPTGGPGGTSAVGAPRTVSGNGIVGGTPQRATSGQVPGAAAARGVSRGTVIGAPGAPQGRAGVSGGRAVPATGANGVVGAPRNASGPGANAKGFTTGGAGLVRGPAGGRNSSRDNEEDKGSSRPGYLTEDEETWNVGRRGAVPPVVEQ
ncbi:hypothetical protein RI138_25720 [Streptomyces sp. C11-1]|uniref:Uncharacterized protein n=1 Tax=Streptomyces durocortorensis TaxID=2811104 RepID=A0ABY9W1Q4_9ACTN|nr:hypothetical protein [Streptomyces durocortorensis]WNF29958.1 hypothetical protein RI138_25720 [Streptomyces durocortorensis]